MKIDLGPSRSGVQRGNNIKKNTKNTEKNSISQRYQFLTHFMAEITQIGGYVLVKKLALSKSILNLPGQS